MLIRTKDAVPASPDARIAVPEGFGALMTRSFEVKAYDAEMRTAEFVASTDVIDAHDEIVEQSSWNLTDYLRNPVVLFAHQSRELPIGQCVDVGLRGGNLECRIMFAPEEMNPLAEQIWKMVQAKFLRAVSVGFVPDSYRWEMREGLDVLVWSDCCLKEISVTPVPANPEALAKMKARALADRPAEVIGGGAGGMKTRASLKKSQTHRSAAESSASAPPPAAPGHPPDTTPTKDHEAPVMTDAEKALQDKLDKSALAIAEARLEAKAAGEKVTAAEIQLKSVTTERDQLSKEKVAFEAQTKTLVTERDAAAARAEKAEGQLIELEVESEIGPGKKLMPAEKEMFVELRKSNHELFKKMLAQRSPMNLDKPVIAGLTEEAGQAKSLSGAALTEDVVAEAQRIGA